jgi:hypothetical protein
VAAEKTVQYRCLAALPKNTINDQFPTRAGGLKKAVTIGLADVALAGTLSLLAAGSPKRGSGAAPHWAPDGN